MKRLNRNELKLIEDATVKKTSGLGLKHARLNAPYVIKTIMDIAPSGKPSVVLSAGPSLHINRSLERLRKSGFKGNIIAVDGTLGHCLRNGVVPDYVLTVDPHPHRIVRWFGDTSLASRPKDDYFRRQDLDPALNRDETAKNAELIKLVNRYGRSIRAVISTSVSPDIRKRCEEAGMELYWWNPLYDDFNKADSKSRKISKMNKAPCMVTGGNCGTSAWIFAHSVLKSPKIILVGMDLSYPPGTTVDKTQYYEVLKELWPEDPAKGLVGIFNPFLKARWFTDPAYYWYSRIFLQMARIAPCVTYNCTEGGILFGKGVRFISLEEAVKACRKSIAKMAG